MIVGIELLADEVGKSGCITFHRNLIHWLSKLAVEETYYVFVYSKEYEDYGKWVQNTEKLKLVDVGCRRSTLARMVDQYWKIRTLYAANKIERVFSDNVVPFFIGPRKVFYRVLTTQQFSAESHDHYLRKLYYRQRTRYACAQAEVVIANSDYTKSEVIHHCRIPANKVVTVYEAADTSRFFPIADKENLREGLRQQYGLPSDYFLQVSGLYDHKNPLVSVRVLAELAGRGSEIELALVGADPLGNWARYRDYAKSLSVAERVHYLGFLMPEQLNAVYNDSICLLYPSVLETFGVPPLEAMATGTPVIGSDAGAVPEVIDYGGLVIDVTQTGEIANLVEKFRSDQSYRNEWVTRGFARYNDFSWQKTVSQLRQILLS
jgi:glycosyltransferase involved in cell wall biosynthesis